METKNIIEKAIKWTEMQKYVFNLDTVRLQTYPELKLKNSGSTLREELTLFENMTFDESTPIELQLECLSRAKREQYGTLELLQKLNCPDDAKESKAVVVTQFILLLENMIQDRI